MELMPEFSGAVMQPKTVPSPKNAEDRRGGKTMRINTYNIMLDQERKPYLVKESGKNYRIDETITHPRTVYQLMQSIYHVGSLAEEHLYMIALKTDGGIIGISEVSHGSIDMSVCNPREIFIRALMMGASNIILVHNHPSGNPTPSAEDIKTTERIIQAGDLIGCHLLDHVIIGLDSYVSLKEYKGW